MQRILGSLVAACAISLVGCKDAGVPDPNGLPVDRVSPRVLEVSPAEGAQAVAATTAVTVRFSEAMDPASLNQATVGIEGTAGHVAYDAPTHTAHFEIVAPLAYDRPHVGFVTTGATDAAGNPLAAAFSWVFTVEAPPDIQWVGHGDSSALPLATMAATAFTPAGNGIAVWQVDSGAGRTVVYSLYDPASRTWSVEDSLAFTTNDPRPEVATNGTGYLVSWLDNASLQARVYTSTGWDTATRLDTGGSGFFGTFRYAASNGLGYAVVWGRGTDVFARVHDGVAWTPMAHLDEGAAAGDSAYGGRVASDGIGYVTVWTHTEAGERRLFSRRILADGTAAPARQLSDPDAGSCLDPTIVPMTGGYCLAWRQYTGTGPQPGVQAAVLDADGAGTGVLVSSVQTIPAFPVVAAYGTRCGVAWSTSARVEAALYDAGWSVTYRLDTSGATSDTPTIAAGALGYVVAWRERAGASGPYTDLYHRIFDAAGWLGFAPVSYPSILRVRSAARDNGFALAWDVSSSGGVTPDSVFARVNQGVPVRLDGVHGQVGQFMIAPGGSAFLAVYGQGEQVYCRAFSTAWSAETSPVAVSRAGSAARPAAITNESGRTLAVWWQYHRGAYARLFGSVHDGTTWGSPVWLNYPDVGGAQGAAVAQSGGTLAVGWSWQGLVRARVHDGAAWRDTVSLEAPPRTSAASVPALAGGGAGYVAAWASDHVYARIFDGAAWGAEVQLDRPGAVGATYDPVATSNGEGYVVAWAEDDDLGIGVDIYAAVFDGAAWGVTTLLDQAGFEESGEVTGAVSNGSGYALSWYLQDTLGDADGYVAVYAADTWGAATLLDAVGAENRLETGPALATDGRGYAAVWSQYDALSFQSAHVRSYNAGLWSEAIRLDEGATPAVADGPVIGGGSGGYAAVWAQQRSTGEQDVYVRLLAGGTWLPPRLLEGTLDADWAAPVAVLGRQAGFAVLAVRAAGSVWSLVSWEHNGATWSEIHVISTPDTPAYEVAVCAAGDWYTSVWTQYTPAVDAAVRSPWSRVRY